jgi:nucleoside-diphosphate-sugar epimerase
MASQIILNDLYIPINSTVLVTGVNGLIGSHVVDQFILAGYKVRGTVRDVKKYGWMSDFFVKRHGDGKFELVQVEDMGIPGCFDEAVRDVAGVVHTTSAVTMTATSPSPAIGDNIKTVMTALESAAKEPSVKRFVLTSSAWTSASPKPNVEFKITADTWNEQAIADAWAEGEPQSNGMTIMMAGKTEAEQAAWKFMKEKKPHFTFNAILPDTVFGAILSPLDQGIPSTAGLIKMLFDGQGIDFLKMILPQYFIDVVDNAKLHVAALIHPSAENERLFGYAEPWNWNDVLQIFREMFPEKTFVEDMDLGRDISTVDNGRALQLLKEVYGMDGWTGLEESVKGNVSSFIDTGAAPAGHLAGEMA